MKSNLSLEYIRDVFLEIEEKNNVFDLKYQDVYFWKLIRFELFELIKKELGVSEEGHPLTKKDKIVKALKLIWFSFCNIKRVKQIKTSDVMFLTHGRKTLVDGEFTDIYLNRKMKELDDSNISYTVIDRPDHYGNHLGEMKNNYLYFERFGFIIREGFYKIFINKIDLNSNKENIENIKLDIKEMLGIDINLEFLIKRRIFRFKHDLKYYKLLLDKINPKKIYLVVSYGKEDLIYVAKMKNIVVLEMQHGVISTYHMGYHFPYNINIPYVPNQIVVQGKYWIDSVAYPINCNINVDTINTFNTQLTTNDLPKENSVVFISQGSIGRELSKIAAGFCMNNSINCYYKLHPSEFNIWKSNYKELVIANQLGKINIVMQEHNIYELIQKSKYVIGVYSTAIYESLMYDYTKVYVINIEGYQYMDYLIKNNYIKLLNEKFTLEDLENSNLDLINDKKYFFA